MAKEYNNGIETPENMAKFRKFLKIKGAVDGKNYPDNVQNWIWWKNNVRDKRDENLGF